MTTKDRLLMFLKFKGIGQTRFEESADLSRGLVNNIKGSISTKTASKIALAYPELNMEWLLNGEGEMLKTPTKKQIPLYDDVTIGGNNEMVANVDDASRPAEWIDAGDWFPNATSAMYHYGDSMTEYPSGCILALKRVNDNRLLINGENYVIETDEFRITKQLQDDGEEIIAYSSNRETYPDGRLIHAPIRIPKEAIRHLDLVLGCVIKKFSTPINIK